MIEHVFLCCFLVVAITQRIEMNHVNKNSREHTVIHHTIVALEKIRVAQEALNSSSVA